MARQKFFRVDLGLFVSFFTEGNHLLPAEVAEGLPSDTKLVRADIDYVHAGFGVIRVVVESDAFDEVKEGDVIPETSIIFRRLPSASGASKS